jgi:hypothetical protein
MNSQRLVMVSIVGMIVVAAWSWGVETASAVPTWYRVYESTTPTISDRSGDEIRREMERGGFIVDRYGNPIEEAVGDYRVDPRGDIFERHSPTTAVPRLPEPSV